MKITLVLLIALLLFVGCSSTRSNTPPPPKQYDQLMLTYTPFQEPMVQRQIPIVFMQVDASNSGRYEADRSLVPFAEHSLCFGNYDLSEDPDRPNTKILKDVPEGSDIAPIRACVTINDKEGTNAASPLQPGIYIVGLTDRMPDAIAHAGIYWDKGKLGCVSIFHLKRMKGQLRLDSVSEDSLSGEVDLSDGQNSIVGTFNGKAKIKKYIVLPMH